MLSAQNTLDQQKILVAGAASLPGLHLIHSLLEQKFNIIGLDNFSSGKKEYLDQFRGYPNFELVIHNLNEELPLYKLGRPAYIFHLAGLTEYSKPQKSSLPTLLVNSQGTYHLLELAKTLQARFLLASSYDLYLGAFSSQSLSNYAALSDIDEKRFSHLEAKRFSENLAAEYFKNQNVNVRIVRLADFYGPFLDLESPAPINRLFAELVSQTKIQIPEDGLQILYPTYITDVAQGLIKAMFTPKTSGGIFTVLNHQEATLLQFAKHLQTFRNIPLDFVEENSLSSNASQNRRHLRLPDIINTQKRLNWAPIVDYSQGIKKTLEWLQNFQSLNLEPSPAPDVAHAFHSAPPQPSKTPQLSRPVNAPNVSPRSLPFFSRLGAKILAFLGLFIFLIFIVFAPFFYLAIPLFSGLKNLEQTQALIKKRDFQKAAQASFSAQKDFQNAHARFYSFNWYFRFILPPSFFQNAERLLSAADNLSLSVLHLSKAAPFSLAIIKNLTSSEPLPDNSSQVKSQLQAVRLELQTALQSLSRAELEINDFLAYPRQGNLVLFFEKQIKLNQFKNISQYRQMLEKGIELLDVFPDFIALGQEKTYLILFQNNMELRPTGGFIGSFGLLKFKNGHLLGLNVFDVYQADGQLKGRVQPPAPINYYLNQPNWFMRDANWSPDFPTSAATIEWFLEKELDWTVDGVFALDLTAVEYLLQALGPQKISGFDFEITSANLFEQAEKQAEVGFFPGSTQKKDFLGLLADTLFNQLLNSSLDSWPKVAQALDQALVEKHFLLNFHQPRLQALALKNHWDGSLSPSGDFLALVEANLGANKANKFVARLASHEITFSKEGEISHRLDLTYQNNSSAETWPSGPYGSYLRFFLPLNSRLLNLDLGQDTKPVFVSELTPESLASLKSDEFLVVQTQETTAAGSTFSVIGLYLDVPVRAKKTITLEYQSPSQLSNTGQPSEPSKSSEPSYLLNLVKQSGTVSFPYSLTINYPSFLTPKNLSPRPELELPQRLIYNTNLSRNRQFIIEFVK